MKKLWIIYLFFVAFLLTGCGQMTKVEKELSKERGNGILLTKNQLNKREKKGRTDRRGEICKNNVSAGKERKSVSVV